MKHVRSINEFWFKKKPDQEFSIELVQELLDSDLDDVIHHGVVEAELLHIIKLSTCRFKPALIGNHPKLKTEEIFSTNYYRKVQCSKTGFYNGISAIYLTLDYDKLDEAPRLRNSNKYLTSDIMLDILDHVNKERLKEFGIGICLNEHHYPGDSIVFYKL